MLSLCLSYSFAAALVDTSETQHQRWGNFVMCSCWNLLKKLWENGGVVLAKLQALHIIDTVLQVICTCIKKDKCGEVCKALLTSIN